jgi:hypothetical protein
VGVPTAGIGWSSWTTATQPLPVLTHQLAARRPGGGQRPQLRCARAPGVSRGSDGRPRAGDGLSRNVGRIAAAASVSIMDDQWARSNHPERRRISAAASVLIMKDHLGVGPLAALDAVQPHGAVLGAGDEALGLQPATAIFRDKNRGSG